MSHLSRRVLRLFATIILLVAPAAASAEHIVETPIYTIDLPGDGGQYHVWGQVDAGGVGYIYRYFVLNASQNVERRFELGIAEDLLHAGLHHEVNPTVFNNGGTLYYDRAPHINPLHNYVWTHITGNKPVIHGLVLPPKAVREMSFEDVDGPTLAPWSLRELHPSVSIATSVDAGLGGLPVPTPGITPTEVNGVPEPSTLALALVGVIGTCLAARRRRTK